MALARNDPELQQTVSELSRKIEPAKPAHSAGGLSFEQARRVFAHALALKFQCGTMEWPNELSAGYVSALWLNQRSSFEDKLFDRMRTCPKFARSGWPLGSLRSRTDSASPR